jgi:hypothetical protein
LPETLLKIVIIVDVKEFAVDLAVVIYYSVKLLQLNLS